MKQKNHFEHQPDGTTILTLTKGLYTIIDTEDFERIRQYRWCSKPIRGGYYAHTGRGPNKKQAYLHCVIVGQLNDGFEIDHKDGDGLNNRRSNFRIVTHSFNCFNVGGRPERGVTFHTSHGSRPWAARITRDGKTYCRYFSTKQEALEHRRLQEEELYPGFTRDSRRTWVA